MDTNNDSLSLFDFLISLVTDVFSPSGKQEDLYDINFTGHYKTLYDLEENCRKNLDSTPSISKIVQDKRTKSLNVQFDSQKVGDEFKDYCDQRNIGYNISHGKLKDITITKNTKGVLEERKWKKEL